MSWLNYGYPDLDCVDKRTAMLGFIYAVKERFPDWQYLRLPDGLKSWRDILIAFEWADACIHYAMTQTHGYRFYRPDITIDDLSPLGNLGYYDSTINADYLKTTYNIDYAYLDIPSWPENGDCPTREQLLNRYKILNLLTKSAEFNVYYNKITDDKWEIVIVPPAHFTGTVFCDYSYGLYKGTMGQYDYFKDSAAITFTDDSPMHVKFVDRAPLNGACIADISTNLQFLDIDV